MKAKVRTFMNVLLGAFLGMFGFSCSGYLVKYGCPSADLELSGQVTNEKGEALENIQVVVQPEWKDTLYTDSQGQFSKTYPGIIPFDKYKIVVNDTAGVYASDSIEQHVTFAGGDGEWNYGSGKLHADFQLKKK